MNPIAVNIRTLRKEKGLSQEQFAQALHVTRQTVSAWERGLSQPGLDTLREIACVLQVEPERLLYGPQAGKKPAYRTVSYLPVLGVLPLYFVAGIFLIPALISMLFGSADNTVLLMGGQIFLCVVVVFCYCSLKDEIRNREYYRQAEEDGEPPEE